MSEYDERSSSFHRLRDEAIFVIENALKARSIKYHSVPSRVKAFKSLLEKAERMNMDKPIQQMHDIVGLRIVCLFLSDIERVGEVLRSCFDVVKEDNKIEGRDASSFGYMSHHFIVTMPAANYVGPRYDALCGIPFEIQVRTIAMEAWATASHYLDYKTEVDVPTELRRDFFALSGLFYVADKHFEMFFRARESSKKRTSAHADQLSQEINFDSLAAYMRSRFPERKHSDAKVISELVLELTAAGLSTLAEIEELRKKHWKAFVADEKANPPYEGPGLKKRITYADVGVVRGLLYIEKPYLRDQELLD